MLPTGVALPGTFTFRKSGVLADPSPLPTAVSEGLYPDATILSPLPVLTHIGTGRFQATVFTAVQNASAGVYIASVYSADTTLDSQTSALYWEVDTSYLAAIFAYAASAVTSAGSALKYILDTLASIVSQTDLIGQIEITLAAPVVGFQIVPLVTNRSYKNSLGNPVTFTVTGLAFSLTDPGIDIRMNVAVNGGAPQAFSGTATDATSGYVDVDPTETVDWLPAGSARQYFASELLVDDGTDAVSIVKWQLPVEPGVGT